MPAGVAATVNGQPITEVAVQRGLKRLPPQKQAEARAEIIDYLVGNALVDQYLQQQRVEVDGKDVDARLAQIREEFKKSGQTFEKVLSQLNLTEDELRAQLIAELRWEKYCATQVSDKDLSDFFAKNPEMFDGSTVRARHILITPPAGDAGAADLAKQRLAAWKQQIEDTVAKGLATLPAGTDPLSREKAKIQILDSTFADLARKESACPSKEQGGDVNWFPRSGSMVEPFAKAAFALQEWSMSDVVATQFGYHLILVTGRRQGKETKFEEVKDVVKEVYCDRLRESLCDKLKPLARIEITPQAKP
jgi:peptidyl-prolyl cis-trans isomerase C